MTTSASAHFALYPLAGVDIHRSQTSADNDIPLGTRVVTNKGFVAVRCRMNTACSTSAAIQIESLTGFSATISAGGYRVQLYASASAGEYVWALSSASLT